MSNRFAIASQAGAYLILIMFLVLLSANGCAQTTVRPRGQVFELGQVEYAAAFEAGVETMREQFAIEAQDIHSGQITARPTVYSSDEPSERITIGLSGGPTVLRQTCWLRLSKRDEGVAAEVRTDIERRDTHEYQVYEGLAESEDLRMRTPAERRDTVGPDQREVWTFIRRDLKSEELIIRGLRERLQQP